MTTSQLPGNNFQALGVDIGGTGIKAGVVNIEKGSLLSETKKMPTPQPSDPEAIFTAIRKLIKEFDWSGPIGCGFPGVVKKGMTKTASNVSKNWIDFPALSKLAELTNGEVNMINDADAAALAEMAFGAGKPYNHPGGGVVMLITLGTGIGTALFVNGNLLPNTELGHIEIDGIEAEKRAATVVREREGWSWEEWGRHVNRYLQTIEFLLSPDVIIVGGGVSESSEKFFPYIDVQAKVVPAKMGNNAGIVGAALGIQRQRPIQNSKD